ARFDGLFPIDLPGPEALEELVAEVHALRAPGDGGFEIVVTNPAGTDPEPWENAGATWCMTGFGSQPTRAEVEEAIEAEA
ncbi:MAG: LLM class flavin-dependent oxidoreductase, partial [Thermoleophilaceae bacterium]